VTFGGFITTGATDYIGSDFIFCGLKLKTAVTITPGTGTVIKEFWNGTVWAEFKQMSTDADAPYTPRAGNIGTVVGSEQVRFGECDGQAKTTVNGIEKYWVRYRLTSDIIAPGEIEQVKLHSNRFEVNADGFTEHFGDSIYEKDLLVHWGLSEELLGFSPQNSTIPFASGLSLVYKSNQLNNGQTSGRGGIVEIPVGMDTSKPVRGEMLFIPLSDVAGDVVVDLDSYQTAVGDTLTVANIPVTTRIIGSLPINSSNVMLKIEADIDVENLVPGELFAFGVKRVGGDVLDTFTGNVAIINFRAVGKFWTP
jgi:hypothetical protein